MNTKDKKREYKYIFSIGGFHHACHSSALDVLVSLSENRLANRETLACDTLKGNSFRSPQLHGEQNSNGICQTLLS
jgi:hypothetical protein